MSPAPDSKPDDDDLMSLDFTLPGAFCELPPAVPAAPAPGKVVAASLAGTLNARVEEPLKQVLKVCVKAPVRVDLARLTDADERGCELLLAALESCRQAQAQCLLAGAGHLTAILAGKLEQGRRAGAHVWLLLLELYQRLGREPEFEDAAVAYAVAFEVSPPSWEPARVGHCEN